MQYIPQKFRPLVLDPLQLPFRPGLEILEILGHPHAGNDVAVCRARVDEKETLAVIKIARHRDAALHHEAEILASLTSLGLKVPRVLDKGCTEDKEWLVLEFLPGERLSRMQEAYRLNRRTWCKAFGKHLAVIHSLDLDLPPVRQRRVHEPLASSPGTEPEFVHDSRIWLETHHPGPFTQGFIHGDHHYANLLWEGMEISAVLDWELSGRGNQEFDLAWAICLRPDQCFFNTPEEEDWILEGYSQYRKFSERAFRWCQILAMSHFWHWGEPGPYRMWIEERVDQLIRKESLFF